VDQVPSGGGMPIDLASGPMGYINEGIAVDATNVSTGTSRSWTEEDRPRNGSPAGADTDL
jgi:hypothetical protein